MYPRRLAWAALGLALITASTVLGQSGPTNSCCVPAPFAPVTAGSCAMVNRFGHQYCAPNNGVCPQNGVSGGFGAGKCSTLSTATCVQPVTTGRTALLYNIGNCQTGAANCPCPSTQVGQQQVTVSNDCSGTVCGPAPPQP